MVTVFTTATCAYCKILKKYLELKGEEFDIVELDNDPERREALSNELGTNTVPVTKIGEEYVIGFDRKKIAELLK